MSSVDHGEVFSRVMMKSAPAPLAVLARGEGARVWDVDGKGYLDFLAGIAVNALGHAHPAFVDAVSGQAARLAHVSNYFATEPQLELAERLTRLAGGDRVLLCNSGDEAVEAAVQLRRRTGRCSCSTRSRREPAARATGSPSSTRALCPPGWVRMPWRSRRASAAVSRSARS